MKISYFVDCGVGESRYYRTKKEALKAFHAFPDAIALEKHWLSNDCFERAYNGGGGFVEKVEEVSTL